MSADTPGQWPGVFVLNPYFFVRATTPFIFFPYMFGHLHVIGGEEESERKELIKKEKGSSRVGLRPTWRTDRACPSASTSPHTVLIFKMDMRVPISPCVWDGYEGLRWIVFLWPISERTGCLGVWGEFGVFGCTCSKDALIGWWTTPLPKTLNPNGSPGPSCFCRRWCVYYLLKLLKDTTCTSISCHHGYALLWHSQLGGTWAKNKYFCTHMFVVYSSHVDVDVCFEESWL